MAHAVTKYAPYEQCGWQRVMESRKRRHVSAAPFLLHGTASDANKGPCRIPSAVVRTSMSRHLSIEVKIKREKEVQEN